MPFYELSVFKWFYFQITFWTSFAASGKPLTKNDEWEPLQFDNEKPFKCLQISREPKMIDLPNSKHLAFWDSLYNY